MNKELFFRILSQALIGLKVLTEYTATDVDDFVVATVKRAVEELDNVNDTNVTKAQLEGLRTEKRW